MDKGQVVGIQKNGGMKELSIDPRNGLYYEQAVYGGNGKFALNAEGRSSCIFYFPSYDVYNSPSNPWHPTLSINSNFNSSQIHHEKTFPSGVYTTKLNETMSGISSAQTVSFTDVSCLNSGAQVCPTTVYVYYPNGSLAGILNGTSDATIDVDANQSPNLYLKPNSVSLLNNPAFTFQWVLNSLTMFFGLLLVFSYSLVAGTSLSVCLQVLTVQLQHRGNQVQVVAGYGGDDGK